MVQHDAHRIRFNTKSQNQHGRLVKWRASESVGAYNHLYLWLVWNINYLHPFANAHYINPKSTAIDTSSHNTSNKHQHERKKRFNYTFSILIQFKCWNEIKQLSANYKMCNTPCSAVQSNYHSTFLFNFHSIQILKYIIQLLIWSIQVIVLAALFAAAVASDISPKPAYPAYPAPAYPAPAYSAKAYDYASTSVH